MIFTWAIALSFVPVINTKNQTQSIRNLSIYGALCDSVAKSGHYI